MPVLFIKRVISSGEEQPPLSVNHQQIHIGQRHKGGNQQEQFLWHPVIGIDLGLPQKLHRLLLFFG